MASPSSTSKKVTLKLLIDTKNEKVLFAEASKAVIDFLFNLLCLPIGTVVKLLGKKGMVGSLGNLYESIENLSQNYMQPNQNKDVLLNPKAQSSSTQIACLLNLTHNDVDVADDNAIKGTRFFTCSSSSKTCRKRKKVEYSSSDDSNDSDEDYYVSHCSNDFTCDFTTLCSKCSKPMTRELRYVRKKVAVEKTNFIKSGFVKDIVTFMVMDDLVVQPISTISGITLLNKFNIKEVGALQEKVVELGMDEGIKLLKASLQSKTVLTNVFLKKQY